MNISVEWLIGISLAVVIPLLGFICKYLFDIKSALDSLASTIGAFAPIFEKIDRSLEDNRNEHTQLMAVTNAVLKEVADSKDDVVERITLLEERIKSK